AVLAARAGGIADRRVLHLPLDGDVHLAVGSSQPLDQHAPHANQIVQRCIRGSVKKRGDRSRELGSWGWEGQIDALAQCCRRACSLHQLLHVGCRCSSARHAHAPLGQDAQVEPCFFRHAGGLEPAGLESDGGLLLAAPQRIRAIHLPARGVEQTIEGVHTSPPISASSMRTWGAPSVTGSGNWPPLPQPPPIWFQVKSPAMCSIRSSVWNRFPASTTSFTSSATLPSRIICP